MAQEARNFSELADLDALFYYAEIGIDFASEHDVAGGVIQPKNSLFYDREDSAGMSEYENLPNALFLELLLKYDIANWIARRNQRVGDGQNQTEDRRLAASQSTIEIERKGGEINVVVTFYQLADLQQPIRLTAPLGGGSV